ncbi:uncharacterized protein [Physcomitrium patens]|uniref:DUF7780 domain-containing protein n=1 Tax=Physcomitrium patens TaxID=3218 RepID=A0A2K1KKY3_PHYPA|nr:uncharacterized protein LOC112281994 [Physcomitrium patens]XP_024374830.1 uncharacterized protein LOC112281994 [Physcomitrium patens]XP_024374831.1 uncharacterized protein LOC112281994 [Physcomitrium patens]PNR54442.1 hypothetical protein PHYPA_008119 [Physcomitrium patens]|eukprot:XP_024374829.1 uncharacterized protein LOC112281994 [Physcomitrella patens]
MGSFGSAAERGSHTVMKLQFVCTILLGLSIVLFSVFAFSIGVIDSNSRKLYNQRPPWPTSESPVSIQRWRVLQSSGVKSNLPPKADILAEKALQGMGTLFRKGTQHMQELIVAHLSENTSLDSLRLFLRTLHRSGATARADVLVLFAGVSSGSHGEHWEVFQEEEENFQKMLALFDPKSTAKRRASDISNSTLTPFNSGVFKRASEEQAQSVRVDVIWGNRSNNSQMDAKEQGWSSYGSIAGFEMQDLDPTNVLSGFLDDPPAQLRRWVCYEMLLGMVKSKYHNVLLTQVKGVAFVGDALAAIRRRQHLYLSAEDRSWLDLNAEEFLEVEDASYHPNSLQNAEMAKPSTDTGLSSVHRRVLLEAKEGRINLITEEKNVVRSPKRSKSVKSSKGEFIGDEQVKGLIPSLYGSVLWRSLDKAHRERVVISSGFVMGKIEYVRKLANKMTTEIVRIALEKKNRRPFHDKAVINYLVHQSSVLGKRVLDHLKIVPNRNSAVHSLPGTKQPHVFWKRKGKSTRYAIIQGLETARSVADSERRCKITAAIHNDICRSPAESQVYQDC